MNKFYPLLIVLILCCGSKPEILSDNIDDDSFSCSSNFSGIIEKYNKTSHIKTKEFHIHNGKRNGISTTWDLKGIKFSEKMFKDNMQHGKSIEWWDNGQMKNEQDFVMGKLIHSINWAKDGTLLYKTTLNGTKNITLKYMTNGEIEEYENDIVNNMQKIKISTYNKSNIKIKEYTINQGKYEGKYIKWNDKGVKIYECNYEKGKDYRKTKQWDDNGEFLGEQYDGKD